MSRQLDRYTLCRQMISVRRILLFLVASLAVSFLLAAFPSATQAQGLPDLVVDVTAWPQTVGAGLPTQVSYTITNHGTGLVATYEWSFYWSSDPVLSADDQYIVRVGTSAALGPGDTRNDSSVLTAPRGAGTYYLLVRMDPRNLIAEEDETNNVGASGPIVVTPPDLVVDVTAWPQTVGTGLPAQVSYTITNQGTGLVASYEWSFYWSSDPVLSADDQYIVRVGTSAALGPGATRNDSSVLTAPRGAGTYYLLVRMDPRNLIAEEDETNNVGASGPITVGPDLAPAAFSGPTTAVPEQMIPLSWTVENVGVTTGDAAAWEDAIYLSTDDILDPLDQRVGSLAHAGGLAGGQSYSASVSVQAPSTAGEYYLILKTDDSDSVSEADEVNNVIVLGPIAVVQDPVILLEQLIDVIEDIDLQSGIENGLDAMLQAASNALTDLNENNDIAADNSLQAFIQAVEAQRGQFLTDQQADELVTRAQTIIGLLSAP
jgi:hypothetical protein